MNIKLAATCLLASALLLPMAGHTADSEQTDPGYIAPAQIADHEQTDPGYISPKLTASVSSDSNTHLTLPRALVKKSVIAAKTKVKLSAVGIGESVSPRETSPASAGTIVLV